MGKEKEREEREGKRCVSHRKIRGEGKKWKEEEKERGRRSCVKEEGGDPRCYRGRGKRRE